MKKTYYKVVHIYDSRFFSSWILANSVEYKLNTYTQPALGAPQALCVFDSYLHARNYAWDTFDNCGVLCFECHIGKEVKRPKSIPENRINGTVFADKVKILNEVVIY